MKKQLLAFTFLAASAISVQGQTVTDTVSLGAGYVNQVWYNLENGTETSTGGANWDFGFQISGFASSIIANNTTGAELYIYPNGDTSSWPTLDTSGMSSWTQVYNSATTWDNGGFNIGKDTSNAFDLGWGNYNFITHHVTADSLYVWKTATGAIKKIWIERLASGVYYFKVADYNGSNLKNVTLSKSNFTGKNFGYYSIALDSVMDIEPMSSSWELLFSRYFGDLGGGVRYPVTGIRTNSGIETAQVYPVDASTFNTTQGHTYSSAINVIGYDWKQFSFQTGWNLQDSLVYFVKTDSTTYWKLVMKDFGGSSNGNYIFEKTKINTVTGIFENNITQSGTFLIYPNPSTERNISIVADLPVSAQQAQINVLNVNGQLVKSENITLSNSFEAHQIQLGGLKAGMYLIQLNHEQGMITKQLILK